MTVKELIEKLQGLPQDAIVITEDYEGSYFTANKVDSRKMHCSHNLYFEIPDPVKHTVLTAIRKDTPIVDVVEIS